MIRIYVYGTTETYGYELRNKYIQLDDGWRGSVLDWMIDYNFLRINKMNNLLRTWYLIDGAVCIAHI